MCQAADCDRPVYARGHCSRHCRQLLRHGGLLPQRVPDDCAVDGCGRRAVTRGWCHGHYLRWSRGGDVRPDVPLARPVRDDCAVDGCSNGAHSHGLCRAHARRLRLHGDPTAGGPLRVTGAGGSLSHGCWWVAVPAEDRHLVPDGRHADFEHRLVLARLLGRPSAADETVHHKDGDRLDDRPEDLELWSSAQPKGQRVEDELTWAWALIARYDPEASGDLDPETGLPLPEMQNDPATGVTGSLRA